VYYLIRRNKKKRQPPVESWRELANLLLAGLGKGLEARSANVNLARLTLDIEGMLLNVRLEHPVSCALGMAHVMPKIGAFAANFTLGHCFHLPLISIRAAR
jgi:hypothetical protein